MNDLVSHRPSRIVDMLSELFLSKGRDIGIPYFAIFSEVILVEMAKGICIHGVIYSSAGGPFGANNLSFPSTQYQPSSHLHPPFPQNGGREGRGGLRAAVKYQKAVWPDGDHAK